MVVGRPQVRELVGADEDVQPLHPVLGPELVGVPGVVVVDLGEPDRLALLLHHAADVLVGHDLPLDVPPAHGEGQPLGPQDRLELVVGLDAHRLLVLADLPVGGPGGEVADLVGHVRLVRLLEPVVHVVEDQLAVDDRAERLAVEFPLLGVVADDLLALRAVRDDQVLVLPLADEFPDLLVGDDVPGPDDGDDLHLRLAVGDEGPGEVGRVRRVRRLLRPAGQDRLTRDRGGGLDRAALDRRELLAGNLSAADRGCGLRVGGLAAEGQHGDQPGGAQPAAERVRGVHASGPRRRGLPILPGLSAHPGGDFRCGRYNAEPGRCKPD